MNTIKQLVRFSFIAAAIAAGVGANAQTVLKFSHTDQQQGARQAGAQIFAKKVAEYTNNRYKVNVFCCSQLGNDPKNIEQLVAGGIDFTVSATGSYAPHLDSLNLTMLPFLFDSYEQGWKFYDSSTWLKAQFDKAPAKGFRFLATWEAGFRSMTTKDVLNTPADAKGKKLWTFPNEMMRWLLEDVGFGVQIMPLPEVYLAIQQGEANPFPFDHAHQPRPAAVEGDAVERIERSLCAVGPAAHRVRAGQRKKRCSDEVRNHPAGDLLAELAGQALDLVQRIDLVSRPDLAGDQRGRGGCARSRGTPR